jgi:hypothetical protein
MATFLVVLLGSSVFAWKGVQAQEAIGIVETRVDYSFGGLVYFWAKASWDTPPKKVQIFFKSIDDVNTIVGEVSIRGNELFYVHDLVRYPLKSFSEIEYWFGIQTDGQTSSISPKFKFFYEDNRYLWQMLAEGPFRVHWYEGDLEFGQMVLDVARASLENAQGLLAFATPQQVDIFVYANGAEMQSTLNLAGLTIVAGHADPELGVMFVSLPPGSAQQMETERQVPHELMHILLFQKLTQDYKDLPTWLLEGLASLNEKYPNPDYMTVLQDAVKKETLIPMASLCLGFPAEASKFFQSYAQADSFTRYLNQEYGADGLMALIQTYAGGVDCERGAEIGLGKTLTQLDLQWQRQSFLKSPVIKALELVFPWVGILLLILAAPILMALNSLLRVKSAEKKMRQGSAVPGG